MFKDYINIIPFILFTYTIKNVCPKTFLIVKNLQKRDAWIPGIDPPNTDEAKLP